MKTKPAAKTLSAKPPRVIKESLTDLHATQAAIRAGYSPHTAAQQAARLLRDPRIRRILETQVAKTAELTPRQIRRWKGSADLRIHHDHC